MAAGKRTSAAKKTAGIKGKRITAKQRVARVKNIAVARKHKKRAAAKRATALRPRRIYGNAIASMIALGYKASAIYGGR